MATQGIVSIRKAGKVQMKLIAGMNGRKAPELAQELKKLGRVPSLEDAYEIALDIGFGGGEYTLVVVDEHGSYDRTGEEPLNKRYRETFEDPEFNPRWAWGTADYVEIVDL